MTREDDFIGQLEGYLDEYEGMTPLPDPIRNAIRAQLPTTRQIGPIAGLMRDIHMSTNLKLGLAAAAVVVAAILGFRYLSGPNVGNEPEASPSPSVAPSAAASPKPLPTAVGTALRPGTYFLTSFPVHLSVDVPTFEAPAEWFAGCADGGVLEQSVCFRPTPTAGVFAVGFPLVDNVVADPCSGVLLDPPVGPTVDDLVSAISNLEGFEATAPLDVTVDGFHGKQLAVTRVSPAVPDCGSTWASGARVNVMGSGEANLVRILDVDGVRIVLTGAYDPAASEADLTTIQQLFASVNIEQ